MGKIWGKALLCIGYLVSFPRGRGMWAASLMKWRHKDLSPPCDGFGAAPRAVYLDAPGNCKWVVVSVCLSPQDFSWEICVHSRNWDAVQASELLWRLNHIQKV